MKKVLLFAVSIIFTANVTFAADKAQTAAAEELLSMMGMEQMFEQSIQQMLNVQLQQNPAIAPFKDVMMEFLSKYMSYESLKPGMVEIYANAFTTQELKDIIAFYKTPAGKKSVTLMPQLMAQGAQLGAAKVQENSLELQQMIQQKLEQQQQ